MSRRTTIWVAVVLGAAVSTSALAQHGVGHGGGVGGGVGGGGLGGGAFGAGHETGAGASASRFDHGFAASQASVGSHTPTSTLSTNPKVGASLTAALGKSGVTLPSGGLNAACNGFRTLGQCIAALHVASNLDVPGGFTALKGQVTGDNAISLGKAIQQLKPSADASAEAKKAKHQADADLRAAERA